MPKSEFSDKEILKLSKQQTKSSKKVDADSILYSQTSSNEVSVGTGGGNSTSKRKAKKVSQRRIKSEQAKKAAESKKAYEEALSKGHTLRVKVPVSGSTQKKKQPTYAERMHQKQKLGQYREQLSVLVDRANERVDRLTSKGYQSRALDTAIQSRPDSYDTNGPLFRSDLRSEKQIKREISRVMAFLNDPTSLSKGAERFNEDFSAEGLFGGQYRAINGKGYSDEVDEEIGDMTLDLYHRILEQAGGWERVMGYLKANSGGLIEYGSTNLINAVYDMVMQMGTSTRSQKKIISRGVNMIKQMVDDYQTMAVKQRSGVDYGLVGYDDTAADRRNYWEWNMHRKGLL